MSARCLRGVSSCHHVSRVFSPVRPPARDKSEKPFGMAFIRLMRADETTLKDGRHELVVYKVGAGGSVRE